VLGLVVVLVAAGGGGRPVGGRRTRVRAVLVVDVEAPAAEADAAVAGVAPVAAGQLERLALDAVLEGAVLLVQPVALDLGGEVVALHHGEVGRRGVVVVEGRREVSGPLGRLVVRVGAAPLVAPDLRLAQQLLDRRRGGCAGCRGRAASGKALVRELVVRGRQVVGTASGSGRERPHMRQLEVRAKGLRAYSRTSSPLLFSVYFNLAWTRSSIHPPLPPPPTNGPQPNIKAKSNRSFSNFASSFISFSLLIIATVDPLHARGANPPLHYPLIDSNSRLLHITVPSSRQPWLFIKMNLILLLLLLLLLLFSIIVIFITFIIIVIAITNKVLLLNLRSACEIKIDKIWPCTYNPNYGHLFFEHLFVYKNYSKYS
jgi:hypothetical protein